MAASLQTYAEALLKDVFLPTIIKLEREHSVLSARLKRTARDIRGAKIISPTMVQQEQGIYTRARGGTIGEPSAAQFLHAEAELKHHYAAIELHGQDRIMSEGNSNERIAEILATKVASIGQAFATDMNRQYWGDSTGQLAVCETTGTVTDVVVDDLQYLRLGMVITIGGDDGLTITAIDHATKTITISASTAVVADEIVYRSGNKDLEILGLKAMIKDTGTYLNIDRAVHYDWQSLLIDHSGALDLLVIDEIFGKLISSRDAVPSILYTDEETVRWIKYLYQKQGIPLDYMNIELGYRAMQYVHPKGACPIAIEAYCPKHEMFILDERYITIRQPKPIHWLPGYDGNIWRLVENKDIERAHIRYYNEMFNINPKSCGRLYGYTTPIV